MYTINGVQLADYIVIYWVTSVPNSLICHKHHIPTKSFNFTLNISDNAISSRLHYTFVIHIFTKQKTSLQKMLADGNGTLKIVHVAGWHSSMIIHVHCISLFDCLTYTWSRQHIYCSDIGFHMKLVLLKIQSDINRCTWHLLVTAEIVYFPLSSARQSEFEQFEVKWQTYT